MATLKLQHAKKLIDNLSKLTNNDIDLYATGSHIFKGDNQLLKYTTIHFKNDNILITFGLDNKNNIREANCTFIGNDTSFDTLLSINFKMYESIKNHLEAYLSEVEFDYNEAYELAQFGGHFG